MGLALYVAVSVVWGMLDHDLAHAGELALMLGALGLETPDF